MATSEYVRLVASVDQQTAEILRAMMLEQRIELAEAIRRMVLVGHMMYEEKANGRKITTTEPDGSDPAEIVLF
jgi:uncharacterized tellurite resistance protein B-like protein